jgi:ABC transport system ATP-binding/permease protein
LNVRVRVGTGNGATTSESLGDVVRLGRNPDCEIAVDPISFPMVSGIHARIEPAGPGFVLVHLSESNQTLVNDSAVRGLVPVRAGDRVRLGTTGPTVEILAIESTRLIALAAASGHGNTVQADFRQMAMLRGSALARRFEIGSGGVIGRDVRAVQYHLEHPHVSRLHASLAVDRGRVFLADLGSANGTFVNGRRLTQRAELCDGDRIDIGPFSLRVDRFTLVSRSRSNNIELTARGLKRVVQDRATGQPLTLLEHINMVVRPREFVCILGPSGSGKSTLLAILSGRNSPDAGTVFLNGTDLYSSFEALKEDIAVVPQRESLHESLTVGAALGYTAELRLPPDLSHAEVDASVSDILEIVGLTARRGTLVRHLSGGQTKRVSLANELVARPSLLFLDEVTSGLDEETDRDVMELFRQVADGGKTVICVTHSLANVEATCHLVVILTDGGRLAFIGTPEEAKGYFGISRLGDVYRKLAGRDRDDWHRRFRGSPFFQRYVVDRMPSDTFDDDKAVATVQPLRGGASSFRQAWILTRRYASIWRGDFQAIFAMLGQGLLVALLLGSVFGDLTDAKAPDNRVGQTLNVLLLMSVSCFWFGCNTAAKELVKERLIFLRERDSNLRVAAYFASKFVVLALLAATQATLLFVIVRSWCQPAGSAPQQWAALTALAVAGTAIGLFISALARSEEVATALLPIVVIPQMILAGVVAPLSGTVELLAKGFISVYWAQRALEGLASQADATFSARLEGRFWGPLVLVLAHAAAGAFATVVVLLRTRGKDHSR